MNFSKGFLVKASSQLQTGEIVEVTTEFRTLRLAGMFDTTASQALRAAAPDKLPVVLVCSDEHIEALASTLSPDARIVLKRCMPGLLAVAVLASQLTPLGAQFGGGLIAINLPSEPELEELLELVGMPLVSVDVTGASSVLDVTTRPARLLHTGLPTRESLNRFILLEE